MARRLVAQGVHGGRHRCCGRHRCSGHRSGAAAAGAAAAGAAAGAAGGSWRMQIAKNSKCRDRAGWSWRRRRWWRWWWWWTRRLRRCHRLCCSRERSRQIAPEIARRERRALCRHRRDRLPGRRCDEGPAEESSVKPAALRRMGQQERRHGKSGRARRQPEVVARIEWQRLTHGERRESRHVVGGGEEGVEPIARNGGGHVGELHRDKGRLLRGALPKVTRGKIRDADGRHARELAVRLPEGVRRQRVPWPQRKEGCTAERRARRRACHGLQGRLGEGRVGDGGGGDDGAEENGGWRVIFLGAIQT